MPQHPARKNWVMGYWCGYLSGVWCKWFVYGPADATATPSSVASVKSRMVCLSGAGLPSLSWKKRPLNGHNHATFWFGIEQCSNWHRNLVPDKSGPRFAWHMYQKPVPEKWSRFIEPVPGACAMGLKVNTESSDNPLDTANIGRHPIRLFWSVTAMANWVASLSSDEKGQLR